MKTSSAEWQRRMLVTNFIKELDRNTSVIKLTKNDIVLKSIIYVLRKLRASYSKYVHPVLLVAGQFYAYRPFARKAIQPLF